MSVLTEVITEPRAPFPTGSVQVLSAGIQTTVQDVEGRRGYWAVGVPPSGAFDELSSALGALAVGNPPAAAGLECVVRGPVLRFARPSRVCLTGALHAATLDGRPVRRGVVLAVPAGGVLDLGPVGGPGMRGYLAVGGGVDVPAVLGSRATFLLGGFGGVHGRALRDGDLLRVGRTENLAAPLDVTPLLPELTDSWTLRVVPGPHGAPDYLTEDGVREFFGARWRVDHRADRTGVRLLGPTPGWSRADGGEAGLHASNLHDSAYPVGGIMLSGDTPVVVGPDGPSLGGFVVAAVVIGADRWKLGQLRPGDSVLLEAVSPERADELALGRRELLADPRTALADRFETALGRRISPSTAARGPQESVRPEPLSERPAGATAPSFTIRRSGDRHLLVEAGPAELDLTVRMWVHLLANALRAAAAPGVTEIVEGVRSLLVAVDDALVSLPALAARLVELTEDLPDPATVTLTVREVALPIAFDHPETHEAMRRYATSVRPDAPWCPDNVEFIRRVNDLAERSEVFDIVNAATYLVVGLGDVYLGAPVAVPIDPRHRLVTTKYNPARTWTPQNAVGIGGIYLCVYGMEGPGGYQLVGRTVPVWRAPGGPANDPHPWLLRQFDRIRFHPVSTDELADLRADIKAGRRDLDVTPATFSVREVAAIEAAHSQEIEALRATRRAAFGAERDRWVAHA
ncbi:5-oxoprolinase/urea amidolyase family protein [Pseudonocardia spinosispora]|uniref:5-oxoprolinase/urea amidolyase family protein n=1 Tax=Pseudonocardia spinosispora TaxID=103441 RepID=UPI000A055FD2|nr:5-oxoprolinase/urea amidolyase family protein [Pseudonocardia spinosispora]